MNIFSLCVVGVGPVNGRCICGA